MIARVETSCLLGIDTIPVQVEVDVSNGLPGFSIVGLPDTACRESQDRVRSALRNGGYQFPPRKITVSLAPADLKKEGSAFDLPIALGILAASDQIDSEGLDRCVFTGELALDGRLRPVTGVLSRASALIGSGKRFVFPHDNLREALCVERTELFPARTLTEAVVAIAGAVWDRQSVRLPAKPVRRFRLDFSDVKGQVLARRGIEVAAAGGHNLLMIGPPGSGKTMLAKRIPTVLCELGFEEAIETTKIHSVAGLLRSKDSLIQNPPFRTPHHTISDAAMVGGGTSPKPGEISLAHNGVLFLDELPEFRRNVLEALRQPLEEGRITVSRSAYSLAFPSQFMLVAAMNPCPCGYFTDQKKDCYCSPIQIKNYMAKISGPLLDRIDIHLYVGALRGQDFEKGCTTEGSAPVRERVDLARRVQAERYKNHAVMTNSRLEGKETEEFCVLTDDAAGFLKTALEELGFSGRAYHKVLKIGRTIADLDGKELIELRHVQEAVQYRSLDRSSWFA